MNTRILLIIALMLTTCSVYAQESRASVALTTAIYEEEVTGNLDKAVELYLDILKKYPDDRPVAAKTLYHLGLVNEKMGKQKASDYFTRLVNTYPDQTEMVALAKTKLAALDTGPVARSTGITIRQVWTGPGVDAYGTPSHDGRYLSYTDWETGDLAIRELATGKMRHLTKTGTQKQPAVFALNSVISPDNKLVAYSWTNEYHTYDLCLVGIDGSGNRILYNSADKDEVYPASWSSDGSQIAARRYSVKGDKAEIISIAVADGSVKVLKTFEVIFWPYFFYSPDNRFLVYDFPVAENSGKYDISIISADGSGETSLIKHPSNDRILGWTPDNKEILFLSDRLGTWDAWIIQVDKGKPVGAPKRIKPDLGQVSPMAFTRDGSFYFSSFIAKQTIQIAPFDLKTGKIQEQLSKILLGSNSGVQWSPDGKYLTYFTIQVTPAGPGWYRNSLHIFNLGTGEERKLTGDFIITNPRWSPDGSSILFLGLDNSKNNQKDYNGGVYRINVKDGHVTELVKFPPVIDFMRDSWWTRSSADLSNDGKDVFYVNRGKIFMRELESGQEKQLYQNDNLRKSLDLSPDGKRLAFVTENIEEATWSILVMPVSGGEPRELYMFHESGDAQYQIRLISWTSDGESLLLTENKKNVSSLWKISPEGGELQKLWQSDKTISSLSIHPDGQQIAFSTSEKIQEIWSMENFLSK